MYFAASLGGPADLADHDDRLVSGPPERARQSMAR